MSKLVLPSFNDAARALSLSLMAYTQETGLSLKPEQFMLRVHPDEWRHWIVTADSFTNGAASQMVANGFFMGFKIDLDATVEPGHPVLRCHWEITL